MQRLAPLLVLAVLSLLLSAAAFAAAPPTGIQEPRLGVCRVHVANSATGFDVGKVRVTLEHRVAPSLPTREVEHRLSVLHDAVDATFEINLDEPAPNLARGDELHLHLKAPGFLPETFLLPLDGRARLDVQLRPAGSLELFVEGPIEDLAPILRLRGPDSPDLFRTLPAIRERRIVVEPLPAGRYTATVTSRIPPPSGAFDPTRLRPSDLGRSRSEPLLAETLLAETLIDVRAGAPTTVTLPLRAPEEPAAGLVSVTGTLTLPDGWNFAGRATRIELNSRSGAEARALVLPLAPAEPAPPGATHRFRFIDSIRPGPQILVLPELGWSARLDVPQGGRLEAHLDVPAPVPLAVEFIDQHETRPARNLRIHRVSIMTGRDLETSDVGLGRHLEFDGRFWRTRCAPGPARLHARGGDLGFESLELRVGPSDPPHRFELPAVAILTLDFTVDGAPAPQPRDLRLLIQTPMGRSAWRWSSHSEMQRRFGLDPRTRVRVRVETPDEFEPIAPFFVETGDELDHARTIELVRKP